MTLLLTHLLAFAAGGLVARYLTTRYLSVRQIEGHTAVEFNPHHHGGDPMKEHHYRGPSAVALVILIAALFVTVLGAQMYVANEDNESRDSADREYADCLTDFAADLVDTLQTRTEATAKIEAARTRKEDALDELIAITQQAQNATARGGEVPDALVAKYTAALRTRITAQNEYRRLVKEADDTRAENPYVSPKVVCER